MRALFLPLCLALSLALLILAAPMAAAAPTCLDRNGDTIRCGTKGAMPVGWKPTAQFMWDKEISRPAEENLDMLAKVICALALFFAMIALMPKFDGSRAQDWDRQEGDDDRRE
jgi:hypothetical protein